MHKCVIILEGFGIPTVNRLDRIYSKSIIRLHFHTVLIVYFKKHKSTYGRSPKSTFTVRISFILFFSLDNVAAFKNLSLALDFQLKS